MADGQQETINVRTLGGKVIPILKSDLATAIKRGAVPVNMAKEAAKTEEEGVLKKAGRGGALGFMSGTTGAAESTNSLEDTLKGLKEQAADMFVRPYTRPGAESIKNMLRANPAVAIPTSLAKGFGETVDDINPAIDNLFRKLSGKKNYKDFDVEKTSHDLLHLIGQLAMLKGGKEAAETPLSESTVVKGAKTGSQELLGVGEKSVDRARAAVEAENIEKLSKTKKDYAADKAAEAKSRVEQSKAETARRSYEDLRDRHAEAAAENLDKAEKMEKMSLDARYEDFRKKVLGVSKEAPNGVLQADLKPVGEAVLNAQKNILKGSAESIKQFKDIMGKATTDFVDEEGGLKPVGRITADQLHGYVTELNEKIYDSGVQGDVRDALKHVRDAAENSVTAAIKDVHGRSAVKAYADLKADYNDYMDTWRDVASGSPLPKVRQLLRQPMAAKRGIPVYREVADILEGAKGEKAIPIIARKRAFGADPALTAKLRQAGEKLSSLPKPKEVKAVERPETPKKSFSAEQFRKEKIGDKAQSLSNLSMWDIAALSAGVEEFFRGKPGTAAAAVSIPIIKRLLARGLSNESVSDWLSKGTP